MLATSSMNRPYLPRVILLTLTVALTSSAALAQYQKPEKTGRSDASVVSIPLPGRQCQGVPATGQASCWNQGGGAIDCTGTGQDGEWQKGLRVGSFPRFTDNGDGTVKDNLTGLTWLRDANCFGLRSWNGALDDANGLADGACGLIDGSMPGGWRLPNVRELQSLVSYGEANPSLPDGHPFVGVLSNVYWTSDTMVPSPFNAWTVAFFLGDVNVGVKTFPHYVWPVRGGQ